MRAGIVAAAGGLQYTVVEITLPFSIILVWKRDIDVKVGCGVKVKGDPGNAPGGWYYSMWTVRKC